LGRMKDCSGRGKGFGRFIRMGLSLFGLRNDRYFRVANRKIGLSLGCKLGPLLGSKLGLRGGKLGAPNVDGLGSHDGVVLGTLLGTFEGALLGKLLGTLLGTFAWCI